MSNKTTVVTKTVSAPVLITAILLCAKAFGFSDISWWWVFSPMIIYAGIIILVLLILIIVYLVVALKR